MSRLFAVLLLAAFPRSAAPQTPPPGSAASERPTLVVLIAVDQLRADYFERFGAEFTGGLARLAREGAFFTAANLDYALAETAPGHATMLSGRFPRSHGIYRNPEGVQDAQYPLLGGGDGVSPFRFRGSTLFDWMRATDPRSRALSVSRKDRSAILMVGRAPQHAYWYARGRFTTSTYYRDTLPAWVADFNARRIPQGMAGRAWELLRREGAYPEPDSAAENWGRDVRFPHYLPVDADVAADSFIRYPWIDDLTLRFALEGARALELGAGPQTDLLAISLSGTDYVGHRYGPFSREAHDQVLRVDALLGAFLDSLFTFLDPGRVLIALTADHGVLPAAPLADPHSHTRHVDLRPLAASYQQRLRARGMAAGALQIDFGMVFADAAAFHAAGIDRDSVARSITSELRAVSGILRADVRSDLGAADTVRDEIARKWLHTLPPDAAVVAVATLEPNRFWPTADWVNHGTPHAYDTHVPMVFWGVPFASGRYGEPVRMTDIAPTLAMALGLQPTEPVDGRALRWAFR